MRSKLILFSIIFSSLILFLSLMSVDTYNVLPIKSTYNALTVQAQKQVTCLAENIYFEAGHEPLEGKKAVASVILNRIKYKTYGIKWKDICHVVHYKVGKVCAFTWACNIPSRPDKKTLDNIKKVVYPLYVNFKNNKPYDNTEKSTYFHNFTVSPNWAEELIKTKIIGNHIFYRQDIEET